MSAEFLKSASSTDQLLGYVKLPLAFFRRADAPACDIYAVGEKAVVPTLLASRNLRLTEDQLDALEQRGQCTLFVKQREFDLYANEILASLDEILVDQSLPEASRFAILQSAVSLEVERTFRLRDDSPFVALAQRMGRQVAALVGEGRASPQDLYALAAHDSTTFVHITNVAAYAVMLADALGFGGADNLQEIAVGALLHDIGKRRIPADLLAKPGALTAEERTLIETHSQRGYEAVCDRTDVTYAQKMMVYQHHEWVDGRGYPVGLTGKDLHAWSKLLAVVDVFDAMTARRPYRTPMTVRDVLLLLADGVNSQFEPEAVKCWISLFRL